MTYEEELRAKAAMMLEAAEGVKFQYKYRLAENGWKDVENPLFGLSVGHYRRKPKIVKHERVIVWHKTATYPKAVNVTMFTSCIKADKYIQDLNLEEIKRETVFCEVEE